MRRLSSPELTEATKETLLVQRGRIQSVTQGDVVLADIPSASSYWKYRIGFIFGLLLILSSLVYHVEVEHSLALGLMILMSGGVWKLTEQWQSWIRYLPQAVTSRLVLSRGLELFSELGVYRTMGRCGAIVVFSRAEKRVLVLGDEALDSAIGDHGWERLCGQIADCVDDDESIDEAACYAFDELEALLEELFPMDYGINTPIRELAEPSVEVEDA